MGKRKTIAPLLWVHDSVGKQCQWNLAENKKKNSLNIIDCIIQLALCLACVCFENVEADHPQNIENPKTNAKSFLNLFLFLVDSVVHTKNKLTPVTKQ